MNAPVSCVRHPEQVADHTCSRCGDFMCVRCAHKGPTGALTFVCPGCQSKVPALGGGGIPEGTVWDFGAVLSRSWELFMAVAVNATLLALLPLVIMLGAGLVLGAGVAALVFGLGPPAWPPSPPVIAGMLGLGIPFLCVFVWIALRANAATLILMRTWLLERRVLGPVEAFGAASGHAWPLFWTGLLESIVIGAIVGVGAIMGAALAQTIDPIAGILLALVTMLPILIYLLLRWLAIGPVVVLEGRSGFDALGRCWSLMNGNMLLTFGIVLVGGGAAFGFMFMVAIFFALVGLVVPVLPNLAQNVIQTVVGVFMSSMVVAIYYGVLSTAPPSTRDMAS